jgi:hypothetical protein
MKAKSFFPKQFPLLLQINLQSFQISLELATTCKQVGFRPTRVEPGSCIRTKAIPSCEPTPNLLPGKTPKKHNGHVPFDCCFLIATAMKQTGKEKGKITSLSPSLPIL